MATFAAGVAARAPGRAVLDLGTGPDAVWALVAARAGASRVYAVEGDPRAAAAAAALVARLEREGELLPGQAPRRNPVERTAH